MAETIDLTYKADFSNVTKQLKNLSKQTGEESKKSVKALTQQFKSLEAATKSEAKALRQTRREAKKLKGETDDLSKRGKAGFESLKQAAEGVGGSVGGAAGMVEKFGRSIMEAGAALGPMGSAAVAAALATAGLAAAGALVAGGLLKLVTSADEWLDSLDEIAGHTVFVEQRKEIEEAAISAQGIGVAMKSLGVIIASELAPAADLAAIAVTKIVAALIRDIPVALNAFDALIGRIGGLIGVDWEAEKASIAVWTAREKEALGISKLIEKGKEETEVKEKSIKTSRRKVAALEDESKIIDQITRAMEAGRKAEEARGMEAGANVILFAEGVIALQAAEDAASANRRALYKADALAAADAIGGTVSAIGDLASMASENAAEQAIHWEEQSAKAHAAGNHAKGRADAERAKTARKAALRSFNASQAAALSEAAIAAGIAAITMIPSFGFMGPAAPAGAAAAAGLALGVQVAAISQQKPPSFAAGGVVGRAFGEGSTPDHVTIQADPREGIVTARGMDALGAGGLEALNGGGGGISPVNITLMLDGATLAAAVATPSVKRAIVAELRTVQGAGRGTSYGRG